MSILDPTLAGCKGTSNSLYGGRTCIPSGQHQGPSPTPTPRWSVVRGAPVGSILITCFSALTGLETISLVHINLLSVHTIFSCHLFYATQSNLCSFPFIFQFNNRCYITDCVLRKYNVIIFNFPKIKNNKILYVNL